jgi:hypothetical protein
VRLCSRLDDANNATTNSSATATIDKATFMNRLSLFLYSPDGYKYQQNLKVFGDFSCYGAGNYSFLQVAVFSF